MRFRLALLLISAFPLLRADDATVAADGDASVAAAAGCVDAFPEECIELLQAEGPELCLNSIMKEHCRRACGFCGDGEDYIRIKRMKRGTSGQASLWETLGYTYKAEQMQPWQRPGCTPEEFLAAKARVAAGEHCGVLEDEQRVKDRGYYVVRNAVPADETRKMFDFVQNLGAPLKYLCGASDVQPRECMDHHQTILAKYPKVLAKIEAITSRWLETGFADEAMLGEPLDVRGSEFISINSWRYRHNSSCLFNTLADVAAPHMAACLAEGSGCSVGKTARQDSSVTPCWMTCFFRALIEAVPREAVREVLAAERGIGGLACEELGYDLFRGSSFEYIMGAGKFWDFGSKADGGWGNDRLLSNMRAWLTKTFATVDDDGGEATSSVATPVYQGWHDWHIDGPAQGGRYHKFFLMVNKSSAESSHTARTNVRLVPADVLYAHTCGFEDHRKEAERTGGLLHPPFDAAFGGSEKMRAWGLRDDWHSYEALGCDIPMNPGDLLFFREDVWHRTQDMDQDRVAMIFDVLRRPLKPQPAL